MQSKLSRPSVASWWWAEAASGS